ncbi:hypothetical protein [Chryseosolibacter histidini]|nr:hypothetical protein [Chryseosolibacter histidini]
MYFLISLLISVFGLSDAGQADQADKGVVVQQEKPGSFYHS